MKCVVALGFVVAIVLCSGVAPAQEPDPSLDSLSFLAGCWEMKVPGQKTVISEQWMSPSGDGMLGMNRTIVDGKMTAFEFLRIVQKGDSVYYVALPSVNDTPTSFELRSLTKKSVTFENLAHDFPQTITYTLGSRGRLTAAVEGLGADRPKRRRIEFPMVRVKCP